MKIYISNVSYKCYHNKLAFFLVNGSQTCNNKSIGV